jgi:hypothetical protein
MSRMSSKDLTPGMKLARAVENKNGLVMIGEGTELTAALVAKIQQMDVPSVYVEGVAKSLPPKDEVLSAVDSRFRRVEEEPLMEMLKRIVSHHIESLYEEHGLKNPER